MKSTRFWNVFKAAMLTTTLYGGSCFFFDGSFADLSDVFTR